MCIEKEWSVLLPLTLLSSFSPPIFPSSLLAHSPLLFSQPSPPSLFCFVVTAFFISSPHLPPFPSSFLLPSHRKPRRGVGGGSLLFLGFVGLFLVWFGLVWFGLVWFGLVWFGLVWFGLVWFGLVWFVLFCFVLEGFYVGRKGKRKKEKKKKKKRKKEKRKKKKKKEKKKRKKKKRKKEKRKKKKPCKLLSYLFSRSLWHFLHYLPSPLPSPHLKATTHPTPAVSLSFVLFLFLSLFFISPLTAEKITDQTKSPVQSPNKMVNLEKKKGEDHPHLFFFFFLWRKNEEKRERKEKKRKERK